jgi:uncharacterized YccA/Bax inhibitor family protein
MLDLRSSNPVLNSIEENAGRAIAGGNIATVGGVVQKTALCITLAIGGAFAGAFAVKAIGSNAMWGICIGSIVVTLVVYFSIWRNPARAVWGAPVYSIAQGASLGVFALLLDSILVSKGIATSVHLGAQAFIITMAVAAAMLAAYKLGLIRPTRRFVAVLSVLTLGVCLAYLAGFVLSFFSIQIPFLSLSSAMEGGKGAMIGIGINVAILVIASLWLVVDFGLVEEVVASGQPRNMEWYCAFALMVTLVWIYIEALKLAFRVAASRN